MAKKDPFQQIMANIDWTRLVPILQPLIIFGAWIIFSKFDKRADAVSKLIAIAEPIPALDLNVPKPVVLASLYHSMEDALVMLDALAQALEELPGVVSEKLQELIKGVKEEIIPDKPTLEEEEVKDLLTDFINLFRPSTWESVKEFGK
jgi:hypothetical protein